MEKGATAIRRPCNIDLQASQGVKGVFFYREEQTRLERARAGDIGWKGGMIGQ